MKTRIPFLYLLILLTAAACRWSERPPADAPVATVPADTTENGYIRRWWKEEVVYQIYPRSFKDSNGDGIGDLRGITSELDYLQQLGVDVLWICPIFPSPNADNGYDVSDYRDIMAEFGTMDDFEVLLQEARRRDMRLLLDLVANHTSDEHPWFVASRQSKDDPYRDYYFWRPPRDGGPPNNWRSFFSGPAWTFDSLTNEYYLHLFAVKQPDLNWDNPRVRKEIYDIMRFWLDKGVDGFRMDVIPFISKDPSFPDYPAGIGGNIGSVYASGPHLHDYLQEMHREVMSRYDMMTVGEAAGVSLEQTPLLVDERRNELNMIFQFDVVNVDRQPVFWKYKPFVLTALREIYTRYEKALDVNSWNTVFLGNHDNPRAVSRFGNDSPGLRVPSAKLLATLLLTQKGTPFIYQGDEIGMTNYPFTDISQFDDIQARNAYREEVLDKGGDPVVFMNDLLRTSRDHARTPMQWDELPNAGFTMGQPWLPVNPNYRQVNARQAVKDSSSVYHYYRQLIGLRKQHPALTYGNYRDLDPRHRTVFCYTRTMGEEQWLVVLNFSDGVQAYTIPDGYGPGVLQMANYAARTDELGELLLRPYEARLYRRR